jgi:hypothetical protein
VWDFAHGVVCSIPRTGSRYDDGRVDAAIAAHKGVDDDDERA